MAITLWPCHTIP